MVKCKNCGVEVSDSFDLCPNCGSDLTNSSNDAINNASNNNTCPNCGNDVSNDVKFCPDCGTPIESQVNANKCSKCGSELPENVLFCPTCGNKVDNIHNVSEKHCPNCGAVVDDDAIFCDECGASIKSGKITQSPQVSTNTNDTPIGTLNIGRILIPTVFALIVAVILSLIGLLLRFSWFSFVLAILISVGFFAATIDNELNASISGLIVGVVLGGLESTLVKAVFGSFGSAFYKALFGYSFIFFIILGLIVGFASNKFLKNTIRGFLDNCGISGL